jgi:hypothetical protein
MQYLILASALLAQPSAARSQTLQNGSFETPQPGNRQLPAGWAMTPAPGYAIALDSTGAPGGRRMASRRATNSFRSPTGPS